MFKLAILLKRKEGMPWDDFVDYYENKHVPLILKHQTKMDRYVRHYFRPNTDLLGPDAPEPEYDAMAEAWFADRAAFEEGLAIISQPEFAKMLAEDEENLFDRSKNRLITIEDRE